MIIINDEINSPFQSERADRDVLSRVRLKEGATINKSLATLGNVINALGMQNLKISAPNFGKNLG